MGCEDAQERALRCAIGGLMQTPETVLVNVEGHPSNPVVINKSDFVEGVHKLYEPAKKDQEPAKGKK